MNTINTTAWANLKKNKGRNILTGIAILLTTFLIFTITTLGSGMIRLQFEAANQLYPAYHFMYRSVSEKQLRICLIMRILQPWVFGRIRRR